VRTDFGFHIIRLTGVRAKGGKSMEALKANTLKELRMEAAAKKFAEAAETFTNMVYEQSDSLKPAAEKFGLKIEQGPWIAKDENIPNMLGNSRLMAALFSEDAIKNRRNTEAIEIDAKNHVLVSARVVEYKPAELLALDKVTPEIEKRLRHDEAAKLAAREAGGIPARLNAGENPGLKWGNPRVVQRVAPAGLPRASQSAVFSVPAGKLPGYASAVLPDGSTAIYRVAKVTAPPQDVVQSAQTAGLRQQYASIVAEEEFKAWLLALRERYGVKINEKLLSASPQQ